MGLIRNYRSAGLGREAFSHGGRPKRLGRTPYRKCANCLLPNDTRSTEVSNTESGLVPKSVAEGRPYEEQVVAGCRLCGSTDAFRGANSKLKDETTLRHPRRGR